MEPKNEGLEDDFPFQIGDFQANHVKISWGVLVRWIRHGFVWWVSLGNESSQEFQHCNFGAPRDRIEWSERVWNSDANNKKNIFFGNTFYPPWN